MWLKSTQVIVGLATVALTVGSFLHYPGNKYLLILFSFVSFVFIKLGFFNSRFFYQKFLVCFLTLGIWLKLVVHLSMGRLSFVEGVGSFKYTSAEFDKLMIVCSVALCAFTLSGLLFEFLRNKVKKDFVVKDFPDEFLRWYVRYRTIIVFCWVILLSFLSYLNLRFGFYQRGSAGYEGSFLIRGVFAWGLLYGFYALSCILVFFDQKVKGNIINSFLLLFLTSAICAIAILSRGFVLNAGASLLIALILLVGRKIRWRQFAIICGFFVFFTVASVKVVMALRQLDFVKAEAVDVESLSSSLSSDEVSNPMLGLLIDRWVGLEGIMRSIAFSGDRIEAFSQIWSEKPSPGTSYYDKVIMNSYYAINVKNFQKKHLFVNIPGFVSWIAILDNLFFTFLGCFLISGLFLSLELMVLLLTKNIFLLALIGQVMAYRVAHFGYLPRQSYLLITTIIVTGFLAFLVDKYLPLIVLSRRLQPKQNK